MWYTSFLSIIDKHAPLKIKRVKYSKQPEWLSDDIKTAQEKRNHFHRGGDWSHFRFWRNKCKILIEKSKQNYLTKIVEEAKEPKEIWSVLKNLKPKQHINLPPSMNFDDESCSDFQDIFDNLNK